MDLTAWKKRLGVTGHKHSGTFVAPTFALDLEPGFIAAARLNLSKRHVQSVAARPLPLGALSPSPNKANLTDDKIVRSTIAEVCERVGNTGGRLGLLIPDVAARVALLQFETLPDDRQTGGNPGAVANARVSALSAGGRSPELPGDGEAA